jgi:hypothetical protein
LLILTRVLTLLISLQWISARSPTLNRLFTFAAIFDGIVQVKPATVIDPCESAEIIPFAALVSTPGLRQTRAGPDLDHAQGPVVAERDRVAGAPVRHGGAEPRRLSGRAVLVLQRERE